jgi:hypothetical protein
MAHEGRDPGAYDPLVAYRYQFDRKTRTWHRWLISGGEGVGFGLDPKIDDLDDDGDLDLVVSGRSGLYYLENLGATDEPRPNSDLPQYDDHAQLLTVQDAAGNLRPVSSRFDWGLRRSHILAAVEHALGPAPGSANRVPLDVRITQEIPADDFTHQKIAFQADADHRVSADLMLPKSNISQAPAILVLRQDRTEGDPNSGFTDRSRSLDHAEQLVRRGYVTVVLDAIAPGADPVSPAGNSMLHPLPAMDTIWTSIRAIDLLESIPVVNAERIGCVGIGAGADAALCTAVLDQRIVATVLQGEIASFKQKAAPQSTQEAEPAGSGSFPLVFAEMLAAIAPRAVYLQPGASGGDTQADHVKAAATRAAAVFELTQSARMLQVDKQDSAAPGQSDETIERSVQWLDTHLRRSRGF